MNAINEKYIRGHFKTDKLGGYVFGIAPDGQKFMFAQVRGWGQLQKLTNGGEIQDANLEHMVRALNAHFPMFEALKAIVACCHCGGTGTWAAGCGFYCADGDCAPHEHGPQACLTPTCVQARAAIAKAEGEE